MDELLKAISPLVSEELERANKKFPQFASAHEGFAVLLEEVEEAEENLDTISASMVSLWNSIKTDEVRTTHASVILNQATELAAEAIQTAAMAKKFLDMMVAKENERWATSK